MKTFTTFGLSCAAAATFVALACSNDANNDTTPTKDGGADSGASGEGGGGGGSDAADGATPVVDAGDGGTFSLHPFTPPTDPGGGGILFAASGEVLALTGYAFPPAQAGDPAFVDGWDVKFTRLLTTVDKITISDAPDKVPGDESQTGAVLAEADGPWAVDLSHSDPGYLPGKGGPGEQAVPIAALSNQNKVAGSPAFKTDGTRYAFGFDVVGATAQAKNVNVDAAGLVDYKAMVDNECAVLYVGVATFKGNKADPACYPAGYDKWPDVVDFKLCFKSPTTYVNCQNPDNDPATPFPSEEHQRGIALKTNASVIGQVTMHTDHPFWDSVLHDSPAHFDQFAARVVGQGVDGGPAPMATLEQTKGVDYTAYADALGNKLNWRYCVEPPSDVHPKFTGPMAFDPQSVPHATGGDPASGLRDYYDYSTYDQSTQGHLNSDGLCFVKRNYPSPK
jgi:hypothetical protein